MSFVLDDDFPQNRRTFYEARVSKRGLISKDLALLVVPSDSVHTVHKGIPLRKITSGVRDMAGIGPGEVYISSFG